MERNANRLVGVFCILFQCFIRWFIRVLPERSGFTVTRTRRFISSINTEVCFR
jgi:hypothetical protein